METSLSSSGISWATCHPHFSKVGVTRYTPYSCWLDCTMEGAYFKVSFKLLPCFRRMALSPLRAVYIVLWCAIPFISKMYEYSSGELLSRLHSYIVLTLWDVSGVSGVGGWHFCSLHSCYFPPKILTRALRNSGTVAPCRNSDSAQP